MPTAGIIFLRSLNKFCQGYREWEWVAEMRAVVRGYVEGCHTINIEGT
jgi:hypothetical protein